ncbi:MAG: 5-bromo-4-chloroindolyl phosphate hydrolysis family protein [Oscillospiraceae bacterium]|nr:5-bromo-4-chloroindolyl phosphate hydrolysis family protein [Oscillospiraceae bacterium]
MGNDEKKKEGGVLPFYGAAAAWVLYALLFDLYRVSHFVFAGLLSVGVFILLETVCAKEEPDIEVTIKPGTENIKKEDTGNPELDKMIRDGQMAVSEMKRLDSNIADPEISAGIRRLSSTCEQIFAQVRDNPDKLPQIRKFMDYYLPTTLKILNAYDRMNATGVSGANIDSTKQRVENIMTTIVTAFDKQLDSLFGSDALDISTDISVMESMLAQEGLAGEKMEAETLKNGDGSDISLEL